MSARAAAPVPLRIDRRSVAPQRRR